MARRSSVLDDGLGFDRLNNARFDLPIYLLKLKNIDGKERLVWVDSRGNAGRFRRLLSALEPSRCR